MAILTGLAGVLGRFAGRLLSSTLGWATILLFGKVSGRKQTVLLLVALASLLEVLLIIGIVAPSVGTFLIAFVPLPSFVDEDLIRLGMLALALLLPLAVGAAGIALTERQARPSGLSIVAAILRGYPFTLMLALTIAFLAVVGTWRKVQALSRRWEDAHVAVIVKPGRYDEVLGHLERVLRAGGLDVRRSAAPAILSTPPRVLGKVAGTGVGSLVPDRLMLLKAPEFEALVYPSDIAIGGKKAQVALARALIASELTDAPAYMTATAEAEAVEDELKAIQKETAPAARQRLRLVDENLLKLTVPYEEWETIYRERLQVERDLLVGSEALPRAAAGVAGPARPLHPRDRSTGLAGSLLALGAIGLIVLDVGLLVADRLAGRRAP